MPSKSSFTDIMDKVVRGTSCHQKCKTNLKYIFEKEKFEIFLDEFVNALYTVFKMESCVYVDRFLPFMSSFCTDLYSDGTGKGTKFFIEIVLQTLKVHNLKSEEIRLNCCKFIGLILKQISDDGLDDDLCDCIQKVMIERMKDPKTAVRLQAISCLVRLQDPTNYECPVIGCYLKAMEDQKASVRCEVTKHIALSGASYHKILDRLRDCNDIVRIAAFERCADIGPNNFSIEDRQKILSCGFQDDSSKAQAAFVNNLLSKWLTVYNGDFLKFLNAIKLDASEDDYETTKILSQKLMSVFLKKHPVEKFIELLGLESKLLPLKDLNCEKVLYWEILVDLLRKQSDGDKYLNEILPELTVFARYVESYVTEKSKQTAKDQWSILDSQIILSYLLSILQNYDFSDEFGRNTVQTIFINILINNKFDYLVTHKLVHICSECYLDISNFVVKICETISDIREVTVVVQQAPENNNMDKEYQLAVSRVRLHEMNRLLEEAVKKENYKEADNLKHEIGKLTDEIKNKNEVKVEVKRTKSNETSTICYCLDILIGLLTIKRVNKIHPSLDILKDSFVLPLCETESSDIIWRVLKSLILLSIIDQNIAKEMSPLFIIPISSYRTMTHCNKKCFIVTVEGVCDLIRLYGVENILQDRKENNANGKRQLYNENKELDTSIFMNFDNYIEIVMDMLEDECHETRNCAVNVLYRLILNEMRNTVPSLIISRIILKWFNPVQIDIQGKLGLLIEQYCSHSSTRNTFEESLLPTLESIYRAPKNSPLIDTNIDSVIKFYITVLNKNKPELNGNFALNLCLHIAQNPDNGVVLHLTKVLSKLEIKQDLNLVKELLNQAKLTKAKIDNTTARKQMEIFIKTLSEISEERPLCLASNSIRNCRVVLENLRISPSNYRIEDESDSN